LSTTTVAEPSIYFSSMSEFIVNGGCVNCDFFCFFLKKTNVLPMSAMNFVAASMTSSETAAYRTIVKSQV